MALFRIPIDLIVNTDVIIEAASAEEASARIERIVDEGPTAVRQFLAQEFRGVSAEHVINDVAAMQRAGDPELEDE